MFDRAAALSREWAAAEQAAREQRARERRGGGQRAGGGQPDGESGAAEETFAVLPDPAVTDRMLRELAEAEQRGAGEEERRALRMARGTLLGVRCLAGGGADPDGERAEAILLLREARAAVPVTEREVRSREAVLRLLIRLVMPRLPELEGQGQQDFAEMMKVGTAYLAPGGPGSLQDFAEVAALLEELAETAAPGDRPELERWIASMRLLSGMTNDRASLLDMVARTNALGTMPPHLELAMNAVAELLRSMPDTPETGQGPAASFPPSPEDLARLMQEWLPAMELMSPGLLKPEEFERAAEALPLATWQDQMTAGLVRMAQALREGRAERLVEAGEPLLEASRSQDAPAGLAPVLLAGLLSSASLQGGNLLDAATAHRMLTEAYGSTGAEGDALPGAAGKELSTTARALLLHQRISAAADDDLDELDDIAEVLLDMRQDLADDDSAASLVVFNLGLLQLRRAMAIGNAGGTVGPPLRRALMYLREAQEHPAVPVALRGVMTSMGAVTSALEQYVDPSSHSVLEEVERARAALGGTLVLADQDIRARLGIALALNVQHERHGDPVVLDTALGELEAARGEINENTGCGTAQEVYKELAGLYRRRGDPGDTARALEATERQLEKVAEDVLLQIGAEHGLAAARAAADRGVTAAGWAAEAGDAVTALRVLEAGRALVLRAVAASTSVPEQLDSHGEHVLAAQWREAARAGDGTDSPRRPADTPDTPETLIPSTLRRRALAALRAHTAGTGGSGGSDGEAHSGPGWQDVADAAQRAGVDAVVHLLVGQGDGAGWALVVRPGAAPLSLRLGGLGRAGRRPLERYLDAARDRSVFTAPGVPYDEPGRAEALAEWEAALEGLCDWAGPAVMGPVLDVVRPGRPARPEDPVRLVLLPAGNLGSVPWHAARITAGVGEVAEHAPGIAVGVGELAEHAPGIAVGVGELAEHAPGIAVGPGELVEHAPRITVREGERAVYAVPGGAEEGERAVYAVPGGAEEGERPEHAVPGGAEDGERAVYAAPGGPGDGERPEHAPRIGAGDADGARARAVYALDLAVISHAASGAEFLRSVGRARLPVGDAPVLVADPRASLPYAEHEVDALRESFYPHARCYGYFVRNGWDRDGTPEELLPLLPGGTAERPATLVELSVHGRVGDRPTVSRLLLHPSRPSAGDGDDPGALTVRQLLGAPSADGRAGAGPLVVLSACETDLSSRDHDEALTLTTAFTARGAADVIGSKWGLDDASSAVLMYVVHHHLAQGRDPALALRLTQQWALDPARAPVPGLPGPLAARIRGRAALPVAAWAPFIHQGNPAPVTTARPGGNTLDTNELLALLVRHREELGQWLDDEQYQHFLAMLERLREAGADAERAAMAVMGIIRSLWPVPDDAGELARLLHVYGRSAAGTVTVPEEDTLLAALEALYAAPPAEPPTPPPPPEPEVPSVADVIAAARRRLLAAPSREAAPAGAPPADVIVLADPDAGRRSPEFQFDPDTGRPREIVVRINRILLADRDPWGAADWWLGGNSWLGGAPAALLGRVPDDRLADAALALVEEGGR
ncbi:CHAT domain-containing protein [Streptomyces sp. T028]|uniref:CHAT domain-containing protein n=1 Tax=Streptomyces sp. T028 TaxID=3394379 RepID=UPI003A8A62C3